MIKIIFTRGVLNSLMLVLWLIMFKTQNNIILCSVNLQAIVYVRQRVPTDKYAKRNNKSELWARRRNNTAQQLLDRKLRHLEKEWRNSYKQQQRDEKRVQIDLRDLENTHHYPINPTDMTGSDIRPETTPDSNESEFILVDIGLTSRPSTTISKEERIHLLPETRFRTSALLPMTRAEGEGHDCRSSKSSHGNLSATRSSTKMSTISSVRPSSDYSVNQQANQITVHGFSTSTPHGTTVPLYYRGRRDLRFTKGNRRRSGPCHFKKDGNVSSNECLHFPCKTPLTYHAFGCRRDDLCSKSDGIEYETQTDSLKPNILKGHDDKPNCEKMKSFNTSWIKSGEDKNPNIFSRVIKGTSFEPAPVDPLLEKIKSGTEEKSINSAYSHARVGIHDRIRGLRQLVKEMKFRNDSVKPPEWAINYGRRVPTRILLNPVVPV